MKLIRVGDVLVFGHDSWCTVLRGEYFVLPYVAIVQEIHFLEDDRGYVIEFVHVVTQCHGFLGELANIFSVLGHPLVSIRLLIPCVAGCSVYDPAELNLCHVRFLYYGGPCFYVVD